MPALKVLPDSVLELTIEGQNSLIGSGMSAGLGVPDTAKVVINGTPSDSLTVQGADGAAGIGGDNYEPAGEIVINSGTVVADGGRDAPGIGSGALASGGSLTVNWGTVKASGDAGADIGSRVAGGPFTFQVEGCYQIDLKAFGVSADQTKIKNCEVTGKGAAASDIEGTWIANGTRSAVITSSEASRNEITISLNRPVQNLTKSSVTITRSIPTKGKEYHPRGVTSTDGVTWVLDISDLVHANNEVVQLTLNLPGYTVQYSEGSSLSLTLPKSLDPTVKEIDDFVVTGDPADYKFELLSLYEHILHLRDGAVVQVKMAPGKTSSNIDRIDVTGNVSLDLVGVNIDLSKRDDQSPIVVRNNGNLQLHLLMPSYLKPSTDMAAVDVQEGSTLTISGGSTGYLHAVGGNHAAGIGGSQGAAGGHIIINSGRVEVTGGQQGAGIGSGFKGGHASDITINGGAVQATGGDKAAGIGGGDDSNSGRITVNGGTVTAEGGNHGAGIGSGDEFDGQTVLISGGKVLATGGKGGAGIGSGYNGKFAGDIHLTGGEVDARGGEKAAGIGGGQGSDDGVVQITGGTTTAAGATSIGGSKSTKLIVGSCDRLNLTNGTNATSKSFKNCSVTGFGAQDQQISGYWNAGGDREISMISAATDGQAGVSNSTVIKVKLSEPKTLTAADFHFNELSTVAGSISGGPFEYTISLDGFTWKEGDTVDLIITSDHHRFIGPDGKEHFPLTLHAASSVGGVSSGFTKLNGATGAFEEALAQGVVGASMPGTERGVGQVAGLPKTGSQHSERPESALFLIIVFVAASLIAPRLAATRRPVSKLRWPGRHLYDV
jgi:hypothetical protein